MRHGKVEFNPIPLDTKASGRTIKLTAHANVALGDVCYINADSEAQIADASVIATGTALFMAIATITADNVGEFISWGVVRNDAWTWTPGGWIFLTITGTTGNTLSQTKPTATNEVVQIVGVALHADRLLFDPQLVQIELA